MALYASNSTISQEDEAELRHPLPDASQLLGAGAFAQFVAAEQDLQGRDLTAGQALWGAVPDSLPPATPTALNDLRDRLLRAVEPLGEGEQWRIAGIAAGETGGAESEVWENLIRAIEAVQHQSQLAREGLLAQGPELAPAIDLEEQDRGLQEICEHLRGGGNLGGLTLLLHRNWKPLIENCRTSSAKPARLEQFEALHSLARLTLERRQLVSRWDRQMTPLGAPSSQDLGATPEVGAAQFIPVLRECLGWRQNVWAPLEAAMKEVGFDWTTLLSQSAPVLAVNADLLRLRDTVTKALPPLFEAQAARLQWRHVQHVAASMEKRLAASRGASAVDAALSTAGHAAASPSRPPVTALLQEAFIARDAQRYAAALARLEELSRLHSLQGQRQQWLARLSEVAPAWASAIHSRSGVHGQRCPPEDVAVAWRWRLLQQELERRDAASPEALERKVEELAQAVRANTAEMIDRRAWAAQVRRTTVTQRQALVGWVQTIKKIGKGTGKRVPLLRAEARRLMNQSRTAVPVWIMSLSRVVENFDPSRTRFDVVIIDEASQSDVMGLIAFYLGRQVVVVGDDEQVSPDAVGQKAEEVQHLIDEHLTGIPNANLYDGQFSVYDVAMSSFGGTICLREHFRCVPDIIRFSNYLSYNGAIKPLRDSSSVFLQPAVIPYRVAGAETAANNVNAVEAQAVASLLVAATEQPEYEDASFGVISMVGLPQAERIDFLLRGYLEPAEYERRRIVCGNAAHFQGDEREVMFISMVNAPRESGPLMMQERPAYRKRLNVAASRARDQMWVVHSLQPDIDLKAGDLRRRFLDHAANPLALAHLHESSEAQAESEFEIQVMRRLIAAGYRVVPQWKVGSYRIDMVVEGRGKRLAVECDGDRYHGLDKLPDDMARQALLERLGWKFARIRGSAFFRDPDAAMTTVWQRLDQMGIERLGPLETVSTSPLAERPAVIERIIGRAAVLRDEWNGVRD